MLKKHNKLIMLLVLVTFMFTIVGSAGAATTTSLTFDDVDPNTVESSAVYRLAGLGILEGYPDGTFGPDNTITRAEFAKIAVYTAGLQDVAKGMSGVATGYPDVPADHWASGWINVATAQGFMKGYPDGSFGPEGQITQAEVITVLMRLLGYNDNLSGVWPSNYVSKAANLDILDDIAFVSDQPATRGEVCIMASEALNTPVVEYVASDNYFTEKTTLDENKNARFIYLLEQSFKDTTFVKNALAHDFTINGDDLILHLEYYNDNQDEILASANRPALDEMKISKNCVFSGGSILDVYEHFIEFDYNKDKEIISISVQPYGVIGPIDGLKIYDKIEVDSSGKAKVDGLKYEFIDQDELTQFGTAYKLRAAALTANPPTPGVAFEFGPDAIDAKKVAQADYEDSDVYKLVLNKNGKIAAVGSWLFPTAGIVESVAADRIYFFEDAAPKARTSYTVGSGDFRDKEIFVQRDGKPVELTDLQPLDTVVILANARGVDYYVIAQSTKVPGTLESAEYVSVVAPDPTDLAATGTFNYIVNQTGLAVGDYVKKATILGVKFGVAENNIDARLATTYTTPVARVSLDGGETWEDLDADTFRENDLWDQDVTVLASPSAKIAGLVFGGEGETVKNYGLITEVGNQDILNSAGDSVRTFKVLKSDNEEYTYTVDGDTFVKATMDGTEVLSSDKLKNGRGGTAGFATYANATYANAVVSFSVGSDKVVDRIEFIDNTGFTAVTASDIEFKTDEKLMTINQTGGGGTFNAEDVVVFNINTDSGGVADPIALSWKELKNIDTAGGNADIYAWKTNNSRELQYIVIDEYNLKSDDLYAIFDKKRNAKDDWVTFVGMTETEWENYNAGYAQGDVVAYTLDGGKATTKHLMYDYSKQLVRDSSGALVSATAQTLTVTKVSGYVLTADGETFSLDEDTVYLDVFAKDSLKTLSKSEVSQGDKVLLFAGDANGYVKTATGSTLSVVAIIDPTRP